MWKILQQKKPKNYVIATGNQYSVKDFINIVAKKLSIKINWKGNFLKEKGYWKKRAIIHIDKKYFRPLEVNSLKGDASLARKELNWKPKIDINKLIDEMIFEEMKKKS